MLANLAHPNLSALLRSTSASAPGDAPVLLLPRTLLDSTPRTAATSAEAGDVAAWAKGRHSPIAVRCLPARNF